MKHDKHAAGIGWGFGPPALVGVADTWARVDGGELAGLAWALGLTALGLWGAVSAGGLLQELDRVRSELARIRALGR